LGPVAPVSRRPVAAEYGRVASEYGRVASEFGRAAACRRRASATKPVAACDSAAVSPASAEAASCRFAPVASGHE